MRRFLRLLSRIYFTGILVVLAALGYVVYGTIWTVRVMQTRGRSITLVGALALLALALAFYYFMLPIGPCSETVTLIVPRGATPSAVADSLQRHQVVTSSRALLVWLRVKGYSTRIQAGKVSLIRGEGVVRASPKLLKAEAIEKCVTIPEGLTIEQTAQRLAAVVPIDTTVFAGMCRDSAVASSLGIDAPTLEGYLFPDTYRFPEDAGNRDILKRMVERFRRAREKLDADTAITAKYTLHEIVTLASIVEKEAMVAWERERIAGVFHNRLRLGYPLGADPTVRYVLKKFNGPLRVSELNTDSPYNTRKYAGLPPGPICSPGQKSLQATVRPAGTMELYFVARWDGSGEHDFSLTNEEHTRKKLRIRRDNERRLRAQGAPAK